MAGEHSSRAGRSGSPQLRPVLPLFACALALWALACGDAGGGRSDSSQASSQRQDVGPGRWREFRTHRFDPGLSDEQRAQVERLEAIGYVAGSVAAGERSGVTRYERDHTAPGLNFFTSGHAPEAVLMDMQGRVLHRWRRAFREVWPDYPVGDDEPMTAYWRRARLLDDGAVVAIFEGLGILKLDRDSRVLWARPLRAHHDLQVLANGEIVTLTREAHVVARLNPDEPVLEDFVSVLDAGGRELRRVSLLRAFEHSDFAGIWEQSHKRSGDIFHTNSLQVLEGRGPLPAFRAGNVLVSMRRLDAIAVVDLDAERVVWARTGSFRRQHDPRQLADGNLLLFDNLGLGERSRALEIDPESGEVVWEYRGREDDPLRSEWCGTAQRLANGNTLVTESDNGRALEVTPGGDVVWEFVNPHRAGPDGRYIATLFELLRLAPARAAWLAGDGPRAPQP